MLTMRPYQTARRADGRAIVEWLAAREDLAGVDEGTRKLLSRWRHGDPASLRKVDHVVVGRFGYHLSDLPDRVWLDPVPDADNQAA